MVPLHTVEYVVVEGLVSLVSLVPTPSRTVNTAQYLPVPAVGMGETSRP